MILFINSLRRVSQESISLQFSSALMRLLRAAWQLMSCNFSILGIFSKGFVYRLRVQGVASAELFSSPASHVAAFVPESKGVPTSVQIYACGNASQSQPVARRSFFFSMFYHPA